MAIKKDTLDQLLDGRDPKEVFKKDGLFDELKKALAERVLNAELDDHLESEAAIAQAWRRNWDRVIPCFAFPEAVRRIIYTANAIEALNAKLRRAVKIRGHFPNDEAATKLIYLVLRQTATEWKMSPREWGEAKTQFAIMFEDRFILA